MMTLEGPYHQWQINAYLSCPQALLLRLQGAEPLFRSLAQCRGTAVHAAIRALHHDQAWERWGEVFDEAWAKEFSRVGPPISGTPEKIDKEYEEWRTAVGNYAQREREARVVHTELQVRGIVTSRSGRRYAVEGTIDQIRLAEDGQGYEVYELKTSSSLPGFMALERNVQLCLYCWCCVSGDVCLEGKWVSAREGPARRASWLRVLQAHQPDPVQASGPASGWIEVRGRGPAGAAGDPPADEA